MRVDHGLDKPKRRRDRPASTHRAVPADQAAVERAQARGDRVATVPHLLAPPGSESAETAVQAGETKREREARRKREQRAAAKRAKEKAGS